MLERVLRAGVDVVRLNFSHGTPDDHRSRVDRVREISRQLGRTIAILQDLQGPKIRVGRFREGVVKLQPGQFFTLSTDPVTGDDKQVGISYRGLPGDVAEKQVLLLDDGKLRLRVLEKTETEIRTVVEVGGALSDHKGINVPGADLTVPALTGQDIAHLRMGIKMKVDWVALSFVRTAEDVRTAREHMNKYGSTARLMAKIEKPSAVDRFPEILEEADGIMVARGDLGVEMEPEQVPPVQKRLIGQARAAGKPVVTATQMLESMIQNPRPTRAEASDVANAIFDGTDAVMLSAETASGRWPVESVEMMERIATVVESTSEFRDVIHALRPKPLHTTQDAIAAAACEVAQNRPTAAIVVFTSSGSSAWRVARIRPPVPILALTPNEHVCNQLAVAFGVMTAFGPDPKDTDEMVRMAVQKAVEKGLASTGERIVIAAGVPFGVSGTTNMIRVEKVP